MRLGEELTTDSKGIGGALSISMRAHSYRELGLDDDAMRVFEEFKTWASDNPAGAGDWAVAYLAIGDAERALEWLNRAADKVRANELDEGFWNLGLIRSNAFDDPILERPEFVEVRARLGFRE